MEKISRPNLAQTYCNMPYSKKWEETLRLRETAWKIKKAAIKVKHPDWTDQKITETVREIFLYAVT